MPRSDLNFRKFGRQRLNISNEFGSCTTLVIACSSKKINVKSATEKSIPSLRAEFPNEGVAKFELCSYFRAHLHQDKISPVLKSNCFRYLQPASSRGDQGEIDFAEAAFHTNTRRRSWNHRTSVNVPVDVDTIITSLTHQFDNEYSFSVNVKRNMIHIFE